MWFSNVDVFLFLNVGKFNMDVFITMMLITYISLHHVNCYVVIIIIIILFFLLPTILYIDKLLFVPKSWWISTWNC